MLFAPVRIGWMDINLEAIATFFFSRVELPYNNGSIFHDEPPAAEEGKENWSDIGKKSRGLRYRINQSSSSSFSSSSFSSSVRKQVCLATNRNYVFYSREEKERKKKRREKKRIRYFTKGFTRRFYFPGRVTRKHENEAVRGKRFGEKKGEKRSVLSRNGVQLKTGGSGVGRGRD